MAKFAAGRPAGERVLDAEAGEGSGFEVMRVKHFSWRDDPAGLATSLASKHDAGYFAPVATSVPFTLLEAAFGHGSSVMMEAWRR